MRDNKLGLGVNRQKAWVSCTKSLICAYQTTESFSSRSESSNQPVASIELLYYKVLIGLSVAEMVSN